MSGEKITKMNGLFDIANETMITFGEKAFDAICSPCRTIFVTGTTLWVIWIVMQKLLLNSGSIDFSFFYSKAWRVIIIAGLLSVGAGSEDFRYWLFDPIVNFFITIGFKLITFEVYNGSQPPSTLQEMVEIIDSHITTNIIGKLYKIESDSWFGLSWVPKYLAMSSFYLLIFIFFILIFGAQLLLVICFSISPIIIMFYGFDVTREYSMKGINLFLNGCFRILMVCASMSLSLGLISNGLVENFIPVNGKMVADLGGTDLWLLLSIAWISIYIHWKSASWADALSGASLGIGAEGAFAVAAAGFQTFAAGAAMKGLGGVGKIASGAGRVGKMAMNKIGQSAQSSRGGSALKNLAATIAKKTK